MRIVAVAIAGALAVFGQAANPTGSASPSLIAATSVGADAWVSSPTDPSRRLLPIDTSSLPASATVHVDATQARQRWRGTGAALTDASVRLLTGNAAATRSLFDPNDPAGAHLDFVRLPISPTDFSPETTTWAWDGERVTPSAEARRAVRYLRREVLPLQPRLRVVATPWSAPAGMKDSGTVRGGSLRDGALSTYADMLVAQVRWLLRHDVPVKALTLGNEPGHSSDYATMLMTDAQMVRLGNLVDGWLEARNIELWAVDHNWSDAARYAAVLGQTDAFDGSAFHCYSGSPDAMAGVPGPRIVTECTGTDGDWPGTFDWDARNLVDRATDAGSEGLLLWNLALDPDHGPVDAGSLWGCKSCRGLLTMTDGVGVPGPEFSTLAHLARAALPSSRVLASVASEGISAAAFRHRDGSVRVFVQNARSSSQVVKIEIAGLSSRSYELDAHELLTITA